MYKHFRFGIVSRDNLPESEVLAMWYLTNLVECKEFINENYFQGTSFVIDSTVRVQETFGVTLLTYKNTLDYASRILSLASSTSEWHVYASSVIIEKGSICDRRYPTAKVTLHYCKRFCLDLVNVLVCLDCLSGWYRDGG